MQFLRVLLIVLVGMLLIWGLFFLVLRAAGIW